MTYKEPHFQYYAFDKDLDRSFEAPDCWTTVSKRGVFNELAPFIDFSGRKIGDKGSIGFSIKRFRTGYLKDLPEWATSNESIQKMLLRVFPKLNTSQTQRKRAGRWVRIITLFYLLKWSESQVAAELNQSVASVKFTLVRINRAATGLTTRGRVRRRKQMT